MANAFKILEKETDESWNSARRKVLDEIELKSNTTAVDNILDKHGKKTDKRQSQKSSYDSVLGDIKSTLIKGKDLITCMLSTNAGTDAEEIIMCVKP